MMEIAISLLKTKKLSIGMFKNIEVKKLNFSMFLIIAALVISYLFLANSVSIANYRKSTLERNINDIRNEIRALNLELAKKRSVEFIKAAAKDFNLIVNDSVQYIKTSGSVAKNP